MDIELFYAATTVSIGDGRKAKYWQSAWLGAKRPKEIAPLIFNISKMKNMKVQPALQHDTWISHIRLNEGLSLEHLRQFVNLWGLLQDIHLDAGMEDTITWNRQHHLHLGFGL